jgi:predicted PurR-regulated permease PerM
VTLRAWVTAAVVFAIAFLVWNVLAAAFSAVLLLFTAILFAQGLQPLVNRLRTRMPFGAAVAIAFGGVVISVVVIGALLIAPLSAELVKLIETAPNHLAVLQEQFAAAQRYAQGDVTLRQVASLLANGAGGAVMAIGERILGGPRFVAGLIGDSLLILLLAIGWMLSAAELQQYLLRLIKPGARDDWQAAFLEIGARLSAYVQGVVLNGLVVGVLLAAALAVLGAPYAVLLGFVAAIFQAIPMVGAVISGPIILAVVLATSGWTKMLVVLAIFSVVQILDQNVLSPIIFGQRVRLSFLLIILATVIGGTLLGIAGAFLAVPAAAVLQVLAVRIVAPEIRRANGEGT